MKSSSPEKTKKAREDDDDDLMEKKSYIYFLVRDSWFVTELDNNNNTQKVDMQYPEVKAYNMCFGSYGTLIYGLGGIASFVLGSGVTFLRSVFFYDTSSSSDPNKGWIEGPSMIATRAHNLGCTHRVVGGKLYVLGGVGVSCDVDESKEATYPWGECLDLSNKFSGEWQALDRPERSKTCDLEAYLYLGVHPCFLGSGEWGEMETPLPFDFASLPMLSGEFDPQRHILVYRHRFSMHIVLCYDVCENQFFRFHGSFALNPYEAQQVFVEKKFVLAAAATHVFAARLFGGDHSSPPWFFGSVQDMYRTNCNRFPPPYRCGFDLLRIAPCKYATLWYDTHQHKLRLSVFSVSLDSPPLEDCGIHFLPAQTHVDDQHVVLDLQPDAVHRIGAAVAV